MMVICCVCFFLLARSQWRLDTERSAYGNEKCPSSGTSQCGCKREKVKVKTPLSFDNMRPICMLSRCLNGKRYLLNWSWNGMIKNGTWGQHWANDEQTLLSNSLLVLFKTNHLLLLGEIMTQVLFLWKTPKTPI